MSEQAQHCASPDHSQVSTCRQTDDHAGSGKLHIAIIGSGSAAFAAAIRASERGARVSMIEHGTLGGTCVNVGCVPSKIMLRAAAVAQTRRHSQFDDGISPGSPRIHRKALLAQQQLRVEQLRQSKYQSILDQHDDIRLLTGSARFVDATTLAIQAAADQAQTLKFDRCLIATGSSPAIPDIPGLAHTPYWTSTAALSASELPEQLIILGAGVVACELGRLGVRVTLLARSSLLSRYDAAIGEIISRRFHAEGMVVREHCSAEMIEHTAGQFRVHIGNESLTADQLLVATGRTPNTSMLELHRAGIDTVPGKAIAVDAQLRTASKHIFAAGDCTSLPEYVYVAAAAGTRAAINMTGGAAELDLRAMPAVVFTDPQVATAGLSERQARDLGLAIKTRSLPLQHVPRALANFVTDGCIKLITASDSGRLLGAQVVADNAGDVIQTAVLAIHQHMTITELADLMFPYLTMVEGLKLAAQTFCKDISQLSCCAG